MLRAVSLQRSSKKNKQLLIKGENRRINKKMMIKQQQETKKKPLLIKRDQPRKMTMKMRDSWTTRPNIINLGSSLRPL